MPPSPRHPRRRQALRRRRSNGTRRWQARARSEEVAAQAQHQASLASQQASQSQKEAVALRSERQAELDRLQSVLSQIASTRKTASGLVVTLDNNAIRFDFDKSAIRPGNREVLSRMAGVLMTLQGYQIYVYGFTDNVGTEEYNQKLSERRAAAVRDYLVQSGVDPKIIDAKGYGQVRSARKRRERPGSRQKSPGGNQHCGLRAAHGRRRPPYDNRQSAVKNQTRREDVQSRSKRGQEGEKGIRNV